MYRNGLNYLSEMRLASVRQFFVVVGNCSALTSFGSLNHYRYSIAAAMADQNSASSQGPTTNADDLDKAAAIQARLKRKADSETTSSSSGTRVPSVEIASGVHKYVLIKAEINGDVQHIVTSRRNASYHRDAAEPMISTLERSGYTKISVTGGGRINCNDAEKAMKIYGFSYGFGLADHSISKQVVEEDPRYRDYDVTISDEGY